MAAGEQPGLPHLPWPAWRTGAAGAWPARLLHAAPPSPWLLPPPSSPSLRRGSGADGGGSGPDSGERARARRRAPPPPSTRGSSPPWSFAEPRSTERVGWRGASSSPSPLSLSVHGGGRLRRSGTAAGYGGWAAPRRVGCRAPMRAPRRVSRYRRSPPALGVARGGRRCILPRGIARSAAGIFSVKSLCKQVARCFTVAAAESLRSVSISLHNYLE